MQGFKLVVAAAVINRWINGLACSVGMDRESRVAADRCAHVCRWLLWERLKGSWTPEQARIFFFLRTNCDGELEENHEPLKLLQSCSCQCGRTPATIPTLNPNYLTIRTHIAQPIPLSFCCDWLYTFGISWTLYLDSPFPLELETNHHWMTCVGSINWVKDDVICGCTEWVC